MKKIIALLLAFTLIFALAACEKEAESSEPSPVPSSSEPAPAKKIGISMPTQSLKRWERDGFDMKSKLEDAGYTVELEFAGDNDVATQITQLEAMISGGCEVLVIAAIEGEAPIEGEALVDVLEGAKEKEIPVIAYNRLIWDSEAISYYVSFDLFKSGLVLAEFIEDALNLKNTEGPFNIEMIAGVPSYFSVNINYAGTMSVLQPYIDEGKLVIKSGRNTREQCVIMDNDTDEAQERMEELIASQGYGPEGEKLDAVWCESDSIAQGVTKALLDAGYTAGENFPIIVGHDCDIASVKNILAGTQSMSAFRDRRELVSRAVAMVDSILRGEEPEVNNTTDYVSAFDTAIPSYMCDPVVCTAENYKELLIESGYYTEDELK